METELITSQLTAAYAASSLLEWLKRKPWFPFANVNSASLNRAMSMLFSITTAIGLHYTFDAESGVLTVTGLTAANVLHTAWAAVQQYALQQAAYKGIVQRADGGSSSDGGPPLSNAR